MRIRRITSVLLLLLVALMVAACGGDADEPASSDARDTKPAAATDESKDVAEAPQATAKLKLQLTEIGSKQGGGVPLPALNCTRSIPATCTGVLECPTAKDATPRELAACQWLATPEARETLEPSADGERKVCTMIYGGPEQATVTGMLEGDAIDAKFSRQDGCEIARWTAAEVLWARPVEPSDPSVGPAAGSCAAIDPDTPVASPPVTRPPSDLADAAADVVCPGTTEPPTAPGPGIEPEVITDPPEAFE